MKRKNDNDEIYTGILRYKDEDYQFVFSDTKLRLIPCSEAQRSSMWKFRMKEITKGTYTQDELPRMEENVLVGSCPRFHRSNQL